MNLKKTIFIFLSLLILSFYIFSIDDKTVNFDNLDERNSYLNSDNWVLKFSTSNNDRDNFKFWKEVNINSGEGYISSNNGIVEFGKSKYGGYIWKQLDFNFIKDKEYMILVKEKSNTKDSYIWIESKNYKNTDNDTYNKKPENFNKIINENNAIFNEYTIKKIHYKCNTNIDELNLYIGYLKFPDLIKVYNGRGYIVTWQPWITSVEWVEIWEK